MESFSESDFSNYEILTIIYFILLHHYFNLYPALFSNIKFFYILNIDSGHWLDYVKMIFHLVANQSDVRDG